MTDRFDPNIPRGGPSDPWIEGEFIGVTLTEKPALGKTNLVVDGSKPFDIDVEWHVYGNLVPLWLSALSVATKDWQVRVYAEPEGPDIGTAVFKGTVAVGASPFGQDVRYKTTLTVPANSLRDENPDSDECSGVYKIVATVFLNSELGEPGYDMMGYSEGPIIKVEDPR